MKLFNGMNMFLLNRLKRNFLSRVCFSLIIVSLLWLQVGVLINREAEVYNVIRVRHKDITLILNHDDNSDFEVSQPANMTVMELNHTLHLENANQIIWNPNDIEWPPINQSGLWPNGIVIVVQVHNRVKYLRKLLLSLSQSRWIEKALLIFSHNIYSEELNEMVYSIPFCSVMQIYFPFSLQLYPSTFPGESPRDCPRDITKLRAILTGCINGEFPDLYGHYREARYSQMKHHWWWKTNFVFSNIRILQNYDGPIVFLEEDHYVAEDFLHVLWLQQQLLIGEGQCSFCNQARILSLGTYPKVFNHRTTSDQVELLPWISSKHNMGMAFNRTVWREFLQCSDMFCNIDDYNWDWSLYHVAQQCLPTKLRNNADSKKKFILATLALKAPRVFHIGECGVHHRKAGCSQDSTTLHKAEKSLELARQIKKLFPTSLKAKNLMNSRMIRVRKGNGGWGDPRDKDLCASFTINSGS